MDQLIMYLDGVPFQTQDIEIPTYRELSYQDRIDARKQYVEDQAKIFKLNFLRAIIKMNFQYSIYLSIQSKDYERL